MCAGPGRCNHARGDAGQKQGALGETKRGEPRPDLLTCSQGPLRSSPGRRQTQRPGGAHTLPAEGNAANDDSWTQLPTFGKRNCANEILVDFESLDPNVGILSS